MKPVRVNPLVGLGQFVDNLMLENPYPDKQIRDEVGDMSVDTSLPKDTMIWETGIRRKAIEGKWVIVEQYPDEKSAKVGHKKWVKMMTDDPDLPIKDIDNWSLGAINENPKI